MLLLSVIPAANAEHSTTAITHPVSVNALVSYESETPRLKTLMLNAENLSKMNLTYLYGSANPKLKGMDCSGTIYYLLNQSMQQHVPRSASDLHAWVEGKGKLHKITNQDFSSPEFSHLQPGDLLFWSGTYNTHKASPISHVMLYLGKNKSGQRLMFGSSDGRSYQGKRMNGVSVFDFQLPDKHMRAKFVGYGCIPGLTCH